LGQRSSAIVEWLGCATFRVRTGGRTLFFDSFVDRIAAAEPVGVSSAEIDEADFLFISHTHLDHVLGADTIALATGAPVVGSHETIRVMAENGVPAGQRWAVSGGETIDCGAGVSVRVIPSLHACIWSDAGPDAGTPCIGDAGVFHNEVRARLARTVDELHTLTPEVERYLHSHDGHASRSDGGQLAYLLRTPGGSILFSSSAGCWSALWRELAPDVAILAVAGRPNLDGEPFQGSLAQFIALEVELLGPTTVVFCHHDAWMPPLPALDVTPIVRELAATAPGVRIVDLDLAVPTTLLA
jgi:L-ascorbate metabolism protein UlaG (beta-lactamase superfamily)